MTDINLETLVENEYTKQILDMRKAGTLDVSRIAHDRPERIHRIRMKLTETYGKAVTLQQGLALQRARVMHNFGILHETAYAYLQDYLRLHVEYLVPEYDKKLEALTKAPVINFPALLRAYVQDSDETFLDVVETAFSAIL